MGSQTQDSVLGRLETALSAERIGRYRTTPHEHASAAYARYTLNVAICEALYPCLHVLEVVLRNHLVDLIHRELPQRYPGVVLGPRTSGHVAALKPRPDDIVSWIDPLWLARTWPKPLAKDFFLAQPYTQQQTDKARRHLFVERKLPNGTKVLVPRSGRPITEGQLVAEMEFGFWTGLFGGYYWMRGKADRRLWPDLLPAMFPHRANAFTHLKGPGNPTDVLNQIRQFRNRVFHHERIYDSPVLSTLHALIHDVIGWISPEAQRVLARYDRVPALLAHGNRVTATWFHRATWR